MLDVSIPRLSLQTLVENAIIHALEKNEHETFIEVGVCAGPSGFFMVYVQDNGPGMNEELLKEVVARMKQDDDHTLEESNQKIGLRNIHRQLISMYGPPSGVYLESEEGKGTKASVMLPLSIQSQEEHR